MERIDTSLPGVFLIRPKVFSDPRGFFFESYHQGKFSDLGVSNHFVQDNHSKSVKRTLRGLHYQLKYPQAKLCRVIQGEVFDVAVDIRKGSPSFGKWVGVILSAENKEQIYIPKGFAHGFLVLSETAEFLYKCDEFYHPEDEMGLAWNDAEIGINWGIADPILSNKDKVTLQLSKINLDLLPELK
jgi:dTDP-4-dehydrorhamnose 3,5-epimerase